MQQIWRRIKEERNRPKRVEINTRGQNNMDRSKAFLVLATAVVLCGFAFLALFSTSGAEKRAQDRRTKPSLGRPEARRTGGATRIHNPASECRPRRRRSEYRATESGRHPGNATARTEGKPAAARAAAAQRVCAEPSASLE